MNASLLAPHVGVILDVADPLKIGRARIRVPGVADEPATAWALPFGAPGAGSPQSGIYWPAEVGAEAVVWFLGGDVDRPIYAPGYWGAPGGKVETPGPVGGYARRGDDGSPGTPETIDAVNAAKIKVFENTDFVMIFDGRADKRSFSVESKRSGDRVVIGENGRNTVEIKATSMMLISCIGNLAIEAGTLTLNGRLVAPSGKPLLWPGSDRCLRTISAKRSFSTSAF